MTTSPFKFLDSYTREDIGSFFGRERETGEMFRLCFTAPILVVYGGSGTGKTSLVQCGLQSKFNESDWLPVLVRRSGDLLASLGDAVAANTLTPIKSADLGEQVANLYLDHFKPIYFLFDQFEELFIFGTHAESEAFFTAIKKLLEKERNAHVIFIVREEYLAELTRYERIIPGLIENRYRVERMARSQAMNVVEQLCATNGITCGEGFSAAMVDRLNPEGQGVELSYLQVYLDRCWRTRQGDEPFSIALLERIGYVDDLLGAFLDEQVADTPDPQRAENLLKAFVSDQGTKRQLTNGEAHEWVNAIGTAMESVEVDRLLQIFVTRRLLKDRDERGRYELLHDALARQVYQRITRAEQELIEVRQFVQNALSTYRTRAIMLNADDLRYIAPYRGSLALNREQQDFVVVSERAQGAAKWRKRRLYLGSLITALLLVLGGLAFTVIQQRREASSYKEILRKSSIIASADLMNVLFMGANNPVSISFPGIDCKDLEPIISDGAEILEGDTCGRYIIRVHTPHQVSLRASATVNGRLVEIGAPVIFRVKRLPDPMPRIVQLVGSGELAKNEIFSVHRLHVKIPNSDFDIDGTVRSFRLTVSSGGVDHVLRTSGSDSLSAAMMEKCRNAQVGDVFVFDSIYAEFGRDDRRLIEPMTVTVTEGGEVAVSLDGFRGNPIHLTAAQLKACHGLRIEGNWSPNGKEATIVSYDCEISEIGSIDFISYHSTSSELTPEILAVFQQKPGLYDIEFKRIEVVSSDGEHTKGQDIWIRLIKK